MNLIILEILKFNNDFYMTAENLGVFAVYSYLNYPIDIQLQIYQTNATQIPENNIYIKEPSHFQQYYAERNEIAINLRAPVAVVDGIYTSGFCAVTRKIIQNNEFGRIAKLLGFKNSCLQAPTETSLWTRFCEIDMISAINFVLSYDFEKEEEFIVPNVFGKFEAHLNQPVRMHNVYKVARETNIDTKDLHKFAEGIYFTLADILLYFSFSLILSNLPDILFLQEHFPRLFKWMQEVESHSVRLQTVLKEIISICCKNYSSSSVFYKVTNEDQQSLYKSDPKRYKPKSRIFTTQDNIDEILKKFEKLNLKTNSLTNIVTKKNFNWADIPVEATLKNGNIPSDRLVRKEQQIKNLVDVITSIADVDDVIVDFCSGSGHLGIILACVLPQCKIIFLENKPFSMDRCKKRIDKLNLTNCYFFQSNIDYFIGRFNIGVSLHACGTATDIVLNKCISVRANFVSCPCCYGSINPMPHISYPRSSVYSSALSEKDYLCIAHTADQTHTAESYNFNLEKNAQGDFCMDLVDTDRKLYAIEKGYEVILTTLKPEECTLKNRLLIGLYKKFDGIKIL